MSKKDFSELLQPTASSKTFKYNHYKPFHDPINNATHKSGVNHDHKEKLTINQQKKDLPTSNKLNTTRTQTEHKLNTKWTQTEHKLNTNEMLSEETGHKVDTELNTELNTKWTQTEHKLNTKTAFSSLVGLQRDLMIFIYNECKIARSKTTKNLSVEHISSALKIPRGSVKTTINRIVKKRLVERASFKNGRGGCASYTVPDFLFQELLQYETEHKLNTKWTQSGHKVDTELNTELNTNPLVVSSSYMNTTNHIGLDIPESWQGIDLTPLEPIGFSESHLVQIYRTFEKSQNLSLSPELIQSSIYAFAFDLKYNNVEKTFQKHPVTVLLSLLKKAQPYNSVTPDKCVSPMQDALEKHQQMLAMQQAKEQQLLQQIKETEFKLWKENLAEEELLTLCPETEVPMEKSAKMFKTVRRRMAKEKAKEYFEAEIWPAKKQALLAVATKKSTLTQGEVAMAT